LSEHERENTTVGTSPNRAPGRRPFVGFDRERATYERLKPALLAKAEGKYVVIVGDEVIGPLEIHEDAELAGYTRFGIGPLYIKQVLAEEPVIEVTRFYAI
jgi:hypothetical protein